MIRGDDVEMAAKSGVARWRSDGSAATATALNRMAAGKRNAGGGSPRSAKMEIKK
ncbi:hypothetical protein LINPERHAP1_LOCUS39008, partial [Linum perenne]